MVFCLLTLSFFLEYIHKYTFQSCPGEQLLLCPFKRIGMLKSLCQGSLVIFTCTLAQKAVGWGDKSTPSVSKICFCVSWLLTWVLVLIVSSPCTLISTCSLTPSQSKNNGRKTQTQTYKINQRKQTNKPTKTKTKQSTRGFFMPLFLYKFILVS